MSEEEFERLVRQNDEGGIVAEARRAREHEVSDAWLERNSQKLAAKDAEIARLKEQLSLASAHGFLEEARANDLEDQAAASPREPFQNAERYNRISVYERGYKDGFDKRAAEIADLVRLLKEGRDIMRETEAALHKAEARAERLAKALDMIGNESGNPCKRICTHRLCMVIRIARAALAEEGKHE